MKRILLLSLIVLVAGANAYMQFPADKFRRILVDKAAFSAEELTRLEGGGAVVKQLRSDDKEEIAVIGVVRVEVPGSVSLELFRTSLKQKSDKTVSAGNMFSVPPMLGDLDGLKLEKRDYAELRKCKPRDCDLNLPAAVINRLAAEIDWNAPEHQAAADQFLRRFLFEYAAGYRVRGDAALDEYANRPKAFDPARAHRMLLDDTLFIKEISPDLFEYIRNFPAAELSGAVSELRWSAIVFGLNPAIVLTHTIAFSQAGQHFVVNKQFYGSRYLDASLSNAILLRVSDEKGERVFLIFTDRSRTDAIGGPFSSLARKLVVSEADERVTKILEKAGRTLLAGTKKNSPEEDEGTEGESSEDFFSGFGRPLIAAGVIVAILLAVRLRHLIRVKK